MMMPLIEALCINGIEMFHPLGMIAVRRFHQQMIVVIHKTVAMQFAVTVMNCLFKQVQKYFAIPFIEKTPCALAFPLLIT